MLYQPREIEVTRLAVESIPARCRAGDVTVSVLCNGCGDQPSPGQLRGDAKVIMHSSKENLGVAGGRNLLLRTPECAGSDIVVVLDNDVIIPRDFLDRITTFLDEAHDAGVVGPSIADARSASREVDSNAIKREAVDALRKGVAPDSLYYLGTDPDYRKTYYSPLVLALAAVTSRLASRGTPIPGHPAYRYNSAVLKSLRNGGHLIEVGALLGCAQVFRRSLIDKVGLLDERFNPYGLEDIDFCIRANQAGYRNYIDFDTWILHGTDLRSSGRDIVKRVANVTRVQTILASKLFPRSYRPRMLTLIVISSLLSFGSFRKNSFARCSASFRGYSKGIAALKAGRSK